MTHMIVRKPVMGKYYSLDFEIVKIGEKSPKQNINSKKQQIIENKLQFNKNSKKQNKDKINDTSNEGELFIVGTFSRMKKKSYLLTNRLAIRMKQRYITIYDKWLDYSWYCDRFGIAMIRIQEI